MLTINVTPTTFASSTPLMLSGPAPHRAHSPQRCHRCVAPTPEAWADLFGSGYVAESSAIVGSFGVTAEKPTRLQTAYDTSTPTESGKRSVGPILIVFGAWFIASVIFFIVWRLASDTVVGNPCQGAGFGCFETDRQGVKFLGFLIGLPATFGWLVLSLGVTSLVGIFKNMH